MQQDNQYDHPNGEVQTLGSLLKAKREAGGLSVTQLAARLGVSRPYLSRLERGEYAHPSVRVLTQLAKCLDVRSEDLYALGGYLLPSDLPSFSSYLSAKHPDWPEGVRAELIEFHDFLRHKYSLK